MKIFEVISRVGESGETVLGAEDTGSHACYLIYGLMKGRERNRRLKPGKGHEEMILAIQGDFRFSGQAEGTLKPGPGRPPQRGGDPFPGKPDRPARRLCAGRGPFGGRASLGAAKTLPGSLVFGRKRH